MMILRPACLEDMPALATLGRESFCDAFAHLYSPENLSAFLEEVYSVEAVTGDFNDPNLVYRLAEDEQGLAGFCKIGINSAHAAKSDARNPMGLNQLYLASRCTGQGIGAALMDWALGEARLRGKDAILLSVYAENFGAQRFYQRYGFAKIADIEFWVGAHRDPEFLYELRLQEAPK